MSETTPTPWSPARDLVTPDPGGHNRMLDRAAAEHLREVAPHLAPSAPAPPQPEPETFDLVTHLRRQRAFSERTFGPGARTAGVLDHIRKELLEIERDPTDLSEWIDVVLLALDGAWRHGYSPEEIASALDAKQAKNEARTWPDWRTQSMDKAIEHDRGVSAPPAEAKGEMSEEGFEAVLSDLVYSARAAGARFCAGDNGRGNELLQIVQAKETKLIAHDAALRTRAREAEERERDALRQRDNVMASFRAEKRNREIAEARNRLWDLTRDDCWAWEGGADAPPEANHLETLIAPVVIRPEVLLAIFRERDDAREQREAIRKHSSAEIGRLGLEVARFRDDFAAAHGVAREADRMLGIERAARVAAEAERDRLRECHRTAAETVWEVSVARSKVEKALAAAEAEVATLRVEVSRLRLAYDDPSLDATDGAHPAWGRGFDTGATVAAVMVEATIDKEEPQCLTGGNADVLRAVSRVAALRASVARLVEAGEPLESLVRRCRSIMYDGAEVDKALAKWAVAKAQVKP